MSGEGAKTGELGATLLLSLLIKAVYRRISEPELGIRLKEFVALGQLRAHPGTTQHELGASLCIDANNLVILLNELEDAGLALRRRDPEDRRRHLVEITPHGLAALEKAEAVVTEAEDEVLGPLTVDERSTLRRLLAKVIEGAPAPAPA
jgi:DNA-binding MarR family transcriptional regulator